MRLTADYHTHTKLSHGKGTIEDNVQAAIDANLQVLGIADHGPEHLLYGVNPLLYPKIKEKINRINSKYAYYGIKVLLGVEANIISFDGTIDVTSEDLRYLDFVLLGYHYFVKMQTTSDFLNWYVKKNLNGSAKKQEDYKELTTRAIIQAMERYPVKAITHPGAKVEIDLIALANKAYSRGVLLEINEKNKELSIENLIKLRDHPVNYIVSSDAHRPEDIGQVNNCLERIRSADVSIDKIVNIEV